MKSLLRKSLSTGATFGVVHIFLILIGFNTLIGTLLARLAGVQTSGQPPAGALLVYTALLAAWAGWASAKKQTGRRLSVGVTAGVISGLVTGMIGLVFNLGLGWLLVNKIDFRQYLAYLSFDFIRATLFQLTPLMGALTTVGVFLAGGALGGLLEGLRELPVVRTVGCSIRRPFSRLREWAHDLTQGRYRLVVRWGLVALLAAAVILLPLKWGSYWNYVLWGCMSSSAWD